MTGALRVKGKVRLKNNPVSLIKVLISLESGLSLCGGWENGPELILKTVSFNP